MVAPTHRREVTSKLTALDLLPSTFTSPSSSACDIPLVASSYTSCIEASQSALAAFPIKNDLSCSLHSSFAAFGHLLMNPKAAHNLQSQRQPFMDFQKTLAGCPYSSSCSRLHSIFSGSPSLAAHFLHSQAIPLHNSTLVSLWLSGPPSRLVHLPLKLPGCPFTSDHGSFSHPQEGSFSG
ncbi:hypothetical protein L7F22_063564 [Adiantum nelumboides]|nr:hypothetical protein [Adiantum nelumboides]